MGFVGFGDVGAVDEDVGLVVVAVDEAVLFSDVEPFDGSDEGRGWWHHTETHEAWRRVVLKCAKPTPH